MFPARKDAQVILHPPKTISKKICRMTTSSVANNEARVVAPSNWAKWEVYGASK
jgi:hypothetical protein